MQNKRGISNIVGYVLLIAVVVVVAALVFQWLRTYVPNENVLECPDGVSVLMKDLDCTDGELSFTLKNNGLFNVDAYSIKATTSAEQKLATKEIGDGNVYLILEPNQEKPQNFSLDETIYLIEITPIRIQEDAQGKDRNVICGDAKIKGDIVCEVV